MRPMFLTAFLVVPFLRAPESADTSRLEVVTDTAFTRDGTELHYRIIGRGGPLLVILAGGPGADPEYVWPVVEELSRTYQCVLFEQRGTAGLSWRPTIPRPTSSRRDAC